MYRGPILWDTACTKDYINPMGKKCMYKEPTLICIETKQDGYKKTNHK